VTRLGPEHFYVLSAAVAQLHDFDQLSWRKKEGEKLTITDVTDDYGVLVLAGPKSREVLSGSTSEDLSNESFRWLTAKEAKVAGIAGVRLLRMNYVGELGWELHVPMAKMPKVFDALMKGGKDHGIKLFGTYAMNSLRMEKAYRGWGSELTTEIDMIEGAMERFLRLDKEDFVGKAATLSKKQRGPRSKLVYMSVDNADSDCIGNEPVYRGEKIVGVTTSGAFGHAVNKSLAFAYVEPQLASQGTEFEVLVLGERRKARIIPESIWDAENQRPRG